MLLRRLGVARVLRAEDGPKELFVKTDAVAAEGAEAAEVAEALTVAVEVDEAVVTTGAIIK